MGFEPRAHKLERAVRFLRDVLEIQYGLFLSEVFMLLMILYSVLGGKSNINQWILELEVKYDFKSIIVDEKYMELKVGRGTLIVA
nr:hypothetical protein [Saccharolobus solfataricus]